MRDHACICACVCKLRLLKAEMTDHRLGSKLHIKDVFVTQVSFMEMNSIFKFNPAA